MNNCNLNPTYKELALLLFPVGHTIYTNDSNFNPNTYYGGTWEQVKDKFILACGDTYKINTSGGEKEHVLTQEELPDYKIGFLPAPVPHSHNDYDNLGISGSFLHADGRNTINGNNSREDTQFGYEISLNGGKKAHNNMPPYVTRYVWTRTA